MDTISIQELDSINQMISNLYNNVVSLKKRYKDFLNQLNSVVHFDNASVYFFYKDEKNIYYKYDAITLCVEKKIKNLKKYDEYYSHIDSTFAIVDHPTPILFRGSDFFDFEQRKNNECWSEHYLPNDMIYSIDGNLIINSNKGLKGGICLYRGMEKVDFTEKDVEIISLLQLHLSNVSNYYDESEDTSKTMFMFENCHFMGVALFDENGEMIRSNPIYKAINSNKDTNEKISNKIHDICMEIKVDAEGLDDYSYTYKFDDLPYFVEVDKISGHGDNEFTNYCCMLFDLSYFFDYTIHQIREEFKLTIREYNILLAILRGKSNDDVASELYLSLPTVKKYLASVYVKLGIKNQKQLLELMKLH